MDVLASRFAPDLAVVVYLAVLVVVATLVFGLTPILRSTTGDPLSSIRDGGLEPVRRDRVRLRSALVVAQVAVTMVLLVAAGMLLRGIVHIARVDPGFDRQDVMVVRPGLALGGYDSARAHTFGDELQARLQAVPGVQATARGTAPLMNGALATVTHPGEPSEAARGGQFNMVSESWFETLGIAIERGRAFTAEEVRQEAPVAILSATTARTLFPGEEALGKIVTIRVTRPSGPTAAPEGPSSNAAGRFEAARVVGIAADAQVSRIGIVNRRYAYVPGNQGDLVVRRRPADAAAIDERIRTLSREIDPDVVLWTRSMEQVIRNSHGFIAIAPLVTAIGAVIGGLSLALAIVGLFGLTAYAVEQRRREFGVRMALGAEASSVVRLVAGQSLRLVAIGALVGVAGAVAGGGVLRRLIFGVRAVDPIAYGAVALLLAIVAFLACWIPARRATRVDPMVALRVD